MSGLEASLWVYDGLSCDDMRLGLVVKVIMNITDGGEAGKVRSDSMTPKTHFVYLLVKVTQNLCMCLTCSDQSNRGSMASSRRVSNRG